jgi:hypothetical protein
MVIPVRSSGFRLARLPALGVALLGVTLASCAVVPREQRPAALERPKVTFSQGRMTVVLVDEYGFALPGMQVNLSWEEPSFYKTSAFTDRQGQVSFSGIPEVAEVSVDHPGGNYTSTVLVPQSGRPEMRVILNTMGGGEQMRERERAMLSRPENPTPTRR